MFDRKETRLIIPACELVKQGGEEPKVYIERYDPNGRDILVFRNRGTGRFINRETALEILEEQLYSIRKLSPLGRRV